MINKKAFTLTELLIALAIIGAIGGLTLPALLGNSNERMLNTKYENTKQQIEHVVLEQMITHRTKVLEDTDFANPEDILGVKSVNFQHTSPTGCIEGNCAQYTAWASVTYNEIDLDTGEKSVKIPKLSVIETIDEETGEVISEEDVLVTHDDVRTSILKNGVLASYYYDPASGTGSFLLDLNGADGPNIIGHDTAHVRDVRGITITSDGKLIDANVEVVDP